MKKFLVMILAFVTVFSMMSCTSTEVPVTEEKGVVLGKYGVPMPNWIDNDVSTQDYLMFTGTAKKLEEANSIHAAEVAARAEISLYLSATVKEITNTYVNEAGEGTNRQVIDAYESLVMQSADALFAQSKLKAKWIAEDGSAHVLLSIPTEAIENYLLEKAEEIEDKSFTENEAAAAANVKMEKKIKQYFDK